MKKITLGISGMSCSACSNAIEKYLNKQTGIISASVNLVMANATIEYDEAILDQKKIEGFIKESGYKSTGIYRMQQERSMALPITLLVIFGILILLMMYLSMGHMIGLPVPKILSMHHAPKVYSMVMLSLALIFIIYGYDIFYTGTKALFHGRPNMDTLVILGVLTSLGYSIYSLVMIWQGQAMFVDNLYFESCAMIIYFIKLGRTIDHASKSRTISAIRDLVQITPPNATILRDGKEVVTTIDEIKIGDIVVCHAGDKIAVDGTITSGSGHFDESFITGESVPATKNVGDKVLAGSINFDGYILYRAEKIGKDSTISEIVRLVVEATNTKMPIAKIADTVSGIFVPLVMAIATIGFAVYMIIGAGINTALVTFATTLVVACPCALGLATPLSVVVSVGVCAKSGILVKKSESLELSSKTNVVVFDKTGTLTYGQLKISSINNYSSLSDKDLLEIANSLEEKSTHPISRAFTSYAMDNGLTLLETKDVENLAGYGLSAVIKNKRILLGNEKLLRNNKVKITHSADTKALAASGNSLVYMAIDGSHVATFGVKDIIREEAKDVVSSLKDQGLRVVMLSGDRQEVAESIGSALGIDEIVAEILPSDKAKFIRKLQSEGNIVMMCGDGINDSPALASANIGVSVQGGTSIAIDSADIILLKDNLSKILDLLKISKYTIRNIKQNLFWAFFYNSLMIPIALGALRFANILINPMIASACMMVSSLSVVFNALRLKLIKVNKER